MEGLRYIYFGKTVDAPHKGIIAVGYRYNPRKAAIEYAIAFCSPIDRFVKAKARSIITARIDNGVGATLIMSPTERGTYNNIATSIKDELHIAIGTKCNNVSMIGYSETKFAGITIPKWVTTAHIY